jgi:hypothetical protein
MDINELLNGYVEDPNFKKDSEKREAATAGREMQLRIVERDFLDAWLSHEFPKVEFAGDIMGLNKKLSVEQVELILKWLPRVSNDLGSQEMLVRALILAKKPFDGQILMTLFDDPDSSFNLKWAIGNTIESTKVQNVEGWLRRKFESLSLEKEKEMLVPALVKYLDHDQAIVYLTKVFDHYPMHAANALAKIGGSDDLNFLTQKLDDYKGPTKAAIKKAMAKLAKKLDKDAL